MLTALLLIALVATLPLVVAMAWNAGDAPPFRNHDPAAISGMTLYLDERTFAPDGSYATTIELDIANAPAYTDLLSVCPFTPELARYFGQPSLKWRPTKTTFKGWRAPNFKHDNVGGGTMFDLVDYNGPQSVGILGSFVSAAPLTVTATVVVPDLTTMVADQYHLPIQSGGGEWGLRRLWDSGTTLYGYYVHQGATVTATPFINLTALGVGTGDLLTLSGRFDGTGAQLRVMRTSHATTDSALIACDGLGPTQLAARVAYGGIGQGLAGYSGPILQCSICGTRNMGTAELDAFTTKLLDKYNTVTGATWPDSAPEQDPATIQPTHLLCGPGVYTLSAGVVSNVENIGSGGDASAAGAQRPLFASIGTLDAIAPDGLLTWLDFAGVESSIIDASQPFTQMGAVNVKTNDEPAPATLGQAGTLAGDSGYAGGICYTGGDGLSRGPAVAYTGTGGPHAGAIFTTPVAFFTDPAVQQKVVYANLLVPGLSIAGSAYVIRSIASGAMVSDFGSPISVAQNGTVRCGNRPSVPSKWNQPMTVPYTWNVALTYPEYQRAHRWLAVRAGIA